jgi:aminoglycoside phosphotransferase family enzyme
MPDDGVTGPTSEACNVSVEVALADKVAFLGAAESHADERPEQVDTVETHLSWVFLTDRFAYKLKKPVRQPLIDLRSVAARHRNCLVEVELNRRLADDVYMDIKPLTYAAGGSGLGLAGDGDVVDWLVPMRRLPRVLMLDHALRRGGPERTDLDRLAMRLAAFYGGLASVPVAPATRRGWYEQEFELSARELGRIEFGIDGARIERIVGRLRDFLQARPELLILRHREGMIVEGHGDLRPEHICLERTPVVIDCVEFNRRLRIVDPADELAFLALECAMLGQPGAGERLQRSYETITGDRPPARLVPWYAATRALVRARLCAVHSREPGGRPPSFWLGQAARYLDRALACTDGLS